MNDFESELKKQRPRKIPSHWRAQILAAAERESRSPVSIEAPWSWKDLLWPSPRIWAGLAAAWVVILFLNLNSGFDSRAPAMTQALEIQGTEGLQERQRLLAELLGPAREPVAPTQFVPRRRSERTADFSVG